MPEPMTDAEATERAMALINDLAPATRRDTWWESDGPVEIIKQALLAAADAANLPQEAGQ